MDANGTVCPTGASGEVGVMTGGFDRHEGSKNFGRNRSEQTDGLRQQIELLENLSEKLDNYFALRTLGADIRD